MLVIVTNVWFYYFTVDQQLDAVMQTQTADFIVFGFLLVDFQFLSVIGCSLYNNENICTLMEKL